MKRGTLLSFLMLLVLALGLISGCGPKSVDNKQGNQEVSKSEGKKYEIRLSLQVPTTHSAGAASEEFAKKVAEKTNNQVEIKVYPGGQLGGLKDNAEGLRQGTIEMAWVDLGTIGLFYPKANVIGLPFLFRDYDHVQKFLDGPLGQKLADEIKQNTGIRIMGYSYSGFRVMICQKPIRKLDDMKLLKIRIPEIPIYVNTMKALGANPTPIPWGELYTSLQTGVVEAGEGPPETVINSKLYEVTKYMVPTHHIFTDYNLAINNNYFQSLPKDIQNVITETAKEVIAAHRQRVKNDELTFEGKLAEKLTKTEVDIAAVKEAVKPVWDDFANKNNAQDLINEISSIK